MILLRAKARRNADSKVKQHDPSCHLAPRVIECSVCPPNQEYSRHPQRKRVAIPVAQIRSLELSVIDPSIIGYRVLVTLFGRDEASAFRMKRNPWEK